MHLPILFLLLDLRFGSRKKKIKRKTISFKNMFAPLC